MFSSKKEKKHDQLLVWFISFIVDSIWHHEMSNTSLADQRSVGHVGCRSQRICRPLIILYYHSTLQLSLFPAPLTNLGFLDLFSHQHVAQTHA